MYSCRQSPFFSAELSVSTNDKLLESEGPGSCSPPVRRDDVAAVAVSSASPAVLRETISVGSSPPPRLFEEIFEDAAGNLSIPVIDTLSVRRRANESTELSSEAAERSTTTRSSQSPAAINPLRSMNPAFSLSPRAANDSGVLHLAPRTPSVTISTDRDKPPVEYNYVLGTVEGRRNFVTDALRLAKQMSKGKIVEELIPVLLMAANYDDSVCSIVGVLPGIVKLVQALDEDSFLCFLGLIMNLCCSADHGVLRAIAASLQEIVVYVSEDIVKNLLLPLLTSMTMSFWSSPRAVAASLLGIFASRPTLVKESGMTVMQWFNCFIELSRDKCQFVQEMAVSSLHQWVAVAEAHQVNIAEMPISLVYECMKEEKSDAVRYLHVAELVRLAECIGKEATAKYLQFSFIAASKDTSWRVRHIAAKHLGSFARLCTHPDDLLDVFVALCADEMKETRAVVVEQLGILFLHVVSQEALAKMCLAVAPLAKDKEPVVRESVANIFYVLLSPNNVVDYTPKQQQALFALLTDKNYVVGRSAMRNLELVAANLGKYLRPGKNVGNSERRNTLSVPLMNRRGRRSKRAMSLPSSAHAGIGTLIPAPVGSVSEKQKERAALVLSGIINQLHIVSDSKNWRTREAVVISIRHFSAALTEEEFMPLVYIIRSLLRDSVSAVRASAVETLSAVAIAYGPEWAALMTFELFQKEFAFKSRTPYMWRVVAIQSLSGIIPVVSGLSPMDLRRQELLQQWTRLLRAFSEDDVSNVRLAVAKSLVEHWHWYRVCGVHRDILRQCAERLQHDSDVDVLQVAERLHLNALAEEGENPYKYGVMREGDGVTRRV
ncbi:putative protein phosphatase 2A regulatory subunit [Trypanosoma cruzi]|uniref:Protein phosphatase 2A regulatory subunit, putative n=2 Tax=Trypanosoma cruzi TaxID=5693 RepID=Q4CWA7_TRYCC|nr:protein phosphatase 2A regulatory subunit, putative [Trypanosoma cruzi]EAN84556.1 protein phosphatase 2A regulatory subunit, putative [Trypanosoma cruzi]PWV01738.1 putative protein phosphatase 2A regulatory subunit [Trypanosoma cruzi]|eukprot:XP_806407.1 protein phosphatase 2A regulatory subunit [Trypanosoma cruzi strain CL Brener]